jgi:hypothetical protein
LASCVPAIKPDAPTVGKEVKRMNFHTDSGCIHAKRNMSNLNIITIAPTHLSQDIQFKGKVDGNEEFLPARLLRKAINPVTALLFNLPEDCRTNKQTTA